MKLNELIGKVVIKAIELGIDPGDLDIDCIDIGSISSIKFDSVDIFIDENHKTITIYEGDGTCD